MEKKRTNKRKLEIENGRRESNKMRRELIFLLLFTFQTIKICFGSTKMVIFYQENAFHAGKKIRKNVFAPPPEKISCYAPDCDLRCSLLPCLSLFFFSLFLLGAADARLSITQPSRNTTSNFCILTLSKAGHYCRISEMYKKIQRRRMSYCNLDKCRALF